MMPDNIDVCIVYDGTVNVVIERNDCIALQSLRYQNQNAFIRTK